MYKLKEDDELQNFEADTAEYTKWLVEKWIKRKDIKGVQDTFTTETITDLTNLNLWLSETRKTGKKTVRVEVFFTAEMNVGLRDIIEHDIIELRKENVRLEQKRTSNEHTNKVGYLTGPIVDRVNMHYYDTLVKHLGDIDEGDVEIKKNRVYDGPEDEWCITIHSTQSAVEQVDYGLRKMSAENETHIKYLSFKNNTRAERIAGLQLNRLINDKM